VPAAATGVDLACACPPLAIGGEADSALATAVTGADLALVLARPHWQSGAGSTPNPFGIVLVVGAGGAPLARRRHPGTVLGVVPVATCGAALPGAGGAWLALIVAFFNAVLCGRRLAQANSALIAGHMRGRIDKTGKTD
jgi:hypothetical protein